MGDWRVPALPNKRCEPAPRACTLTPEVGERFSVFHFGLIISQCEQENHEEAYAKAGRPKVSQTGCMVQKFAERYRIVRQQLQQGS